MSPHDASNYSTTVEAAPKTHHPATHHDDTTKSPDTMILLVTLLALAGWGASVFFFGVPGLYIPALVMVPVIWIGLLVISRG